MIRETSPTGGYGRSVPSVCLLRCAVVTMRWPCEGHATIPSVLVFGCSKGVIRQSVVSTYTYDCVRHQLSKTPPVAFQVPSGTCLRGSRHAYPRLSLSTLFMFHSFRLTGRVPAPRAVYMHDIPTHCPRRSAGRTDQDSTPALDTICI